MEAYESTLSSVVVVGGSAGPRLARAKGGVAVVAMACLLAITGSVPGTSGARETPAATGVRSTGSNLTANASFFDDGGSWNCGQGHETIYLFGNAIGGAGPYQFNWTFGDGTPGSATQDPVHVYHMAGVFRVNLTVTDAEGGRTNASLIPIWGIPAVCTASPGPFGPLGWVGVTLYAALILGIIAVVLVVRRSRRPPAPLPRQVSNLSWAGPGPDDGTGGDGDRSIFASVLD